ncbi:hypothetical protein AVEN_147542-1 [Araneus ventricosus]|uniref:Uncharacterized protein n=2 Tax=Araneus ventricosus TaxID=182803 RepID=A0A4Y2MNJ6_ARAVE|nr:hypothetical protein AVEN_262422-1 [Araneus ventricosus]GBN27910.1 hypothetical protein AVEN_31423-1 [Araneus ventricosus]GBN27942.1 hypothetical protein AVEN_147542-1 [Araneus ventricosus]
MVEVQKRFRVEFYTNPSGKLTTRWIKGKFEADVTIQNVRRQLSGKSKSSTYAATEESVWKCIVSRENRKKIMKIIQIGEMNFLNDIWRNIKRTSTFKYD